MPAQLLQSTVSDEGRLLPRGTMLYACQKPGGMSRVLKAQADAGGGTRCIFVTDAEDGSGEGFVISTKLVRIVPKAAS